jgi:peptidoglycan/xylan/chitin deacetylase (PgdA/CDA1 family)
MSVKQTVLRVCSALMPDLYRPPASVLFPYAHIITDDPPAHVKHLFSVPNIARFKSDLDFLCRQFRPLQIAELEQLPRLRDNNASPRAFILSFDDGMREIYDIIAPILHDKNIPAIFFVNSATIDNKRLMWRHKVSLLIDRSKQQSGRIPPQLELRSGESLHAKLKTLRFADESILDDVARFFEVDFDEYLRRCEPYLTTSQVSELSRAGFEFGSHSDSHPYFYELAVEDQEKQIAASVDFIQKLGLPCRYFAFPFHDSGVPTCVFRYMTDLGLILSFGTSEARVDSVAFSFQRFAIDARGTANSSIRDILKELSVKSLMRRVSRTEVIRRN